MTFIPLILSLKRFSNASTSPILNVKTETGVYSMMKKSQSKRNAVVIFECTTRKSSKCQYRIRVKMVHTNDPFNAMFWELENWVILGACATHTCKLRAGLQRLDPEKYRPVGPEISEISSDSESCKALKSDQKLDLNIA